MVWARLENVDLGDLPDLLDLQGRTEHLALPLRMVSISPQSGIEMTNIKRQCFVLDGRHAKEILLGFPQIEPQMFLLKFVEPARRNGTRGKKGIVLTQKFRFGLCENSF